mgnify:FL=1
MSDRSFSRFDEIGYWSEIKLEILKEYAKAYCVILSKHRFQFSYIDGFSGPGSSLSETSGELIPGSPLNAIRIRPAFSSVFLVDLDGDKVDQLRSNPELYGRTDVTILEGNCNEVLLKDVFPLLRYEDFRRGLCVLDPYGLHLDWRVIETAGRMRSIDLFINFPIMDMNRNVLRRKPETVSPKDAARMTTFWGDESWRDAAYEWSTDLFGEEVISKKSNDDVVDAFRDRLRTDGGFPHVPDPIPMRNNRNAVVYYLMFASQKENASKIAGDIFSKYRNRMY